MGATDVAWMPVSGIWVRYTSLARRRTERRQAAQVPAPGRWQPAGARRVYLADSEDTLADSEDTAWAEFYRALAERGQSPQDEMPCEVIRVRVELERVADLRTEKARRALGLPRIRPTRTQWPAFQVVGAQLLTADAEGVLYASAARTRSLCLCVYEAGLDRLSLEAEPVRVVAPPPPPRGLRT
jgi:RES domain-containing protein